MHYLAVVHKDPTSSYGVTIPDLPGCFSGGDTIEEALVNAVEAIECHVEGLLKLGQPIPERIPFEHHRRNPDYADGIWGVVPIDVSRLAIAGA